MHARNREPIAFSATGSFFCARVCFRRAARNSKHPPPREQNEKRFFNHLPRLSYIHRSVFPAGYLPTVKPVHERGEQRCPLSTFPANDFLSRKRGRCIPLPDSATCTDKNSARSASRTPLSRSFSLLFLCFIHSVSLSLFLVLALSLSLSWPIAEAYLSQPRRIGCALRYNTKIGRPILVSAPSFRHLFAYRHLRPLVTTIAK